MPGFDVSVASSSAYPQSGSNRTYNEACNELVQYFGGDNDPDLIGRAGSSYNAAIRAYNDVNWRFNRMQQTITLVASTSSYTLADDFKAPLRAVVLDSNSKEVCAVQNVPYQNRIDYDADTVQTVSVPEWYELRTPHQAGTIVFWPPLGATLTYPTVRLDYFRWILTVTGDSRLNVPRDFEQAVFEWATWDLSKKVDISTAREHERQARLSRGMMDANYRDWTPVPVIGVA